MEQAVRRVKGVKAIAEDLELRPILAQKTADDEIAKRASDILTWDASVPHPDIQIKVHQGHVTLSGVVEWQFQRLAAEQAVRKLGGVIGISNLITLKPKAAAPGHVHLSGGNWGGWQCNRLRPRAVLRIGAAAGGAGHVPIRGVTSFAGEAAASAFIR